jgi:hypothetical protein
MFGMTREPFYDFAGQDWYQESLPDYPATEVKVYRPTTTNSPAKTTAVEN